MVGATARAPLGTLCMIHVLRIPPPDALGLLVTACRSGGNER